MQEFLSGSAIDLELTSGPAIDTALATANKLGSIHPWRLMVIQFECIGWDCNLEDMAPK